MSLFPNTKLALAEYDRTEPERSQAWYDANCEADVHACFREDNAAIDKVRRAFLEDTKHVNNWNQVMAATLSDMREFCK